ncbi:MAG: hypothetical protein HQM08_23095 [Candidatus Riflebacteria bacterium]|nr:hypothetical protein [Candidatus Riflebacteria bacterium]
MKYSKRLIRNLLLVSLPIFAFFFYALVCNAASHCPNCDTFNSDDAEVCKKCLITLPKYLASPRKRPASVVVRKGRDAFIRSTDVAHFPERFFEKELPGGYGPIGSWNQPTSLRYLLYFDLPGAFEEAGIDMKDFEPEKALVLLTLCEKSETKYPIPIAAFPLTEEFAGNSEKSFPPWESDGANWTFRLPCVYWFHEGGDFLASPSASTVIPALGGGEIEIDITSIVRFRFDEFKKTGIWKDPGIIIMRNSGIESNCLYRNVYGFRAMEFFQKDKKNPRYISPELYLD